MRTYLNSETFCFKIQFIWEIKAICIFFYTWLFNLSEGCSCMVDSASYTIVSLQQNSSEVNHCLRLDRYKFDTAAHYINHVTQGIGWAATPMPVELRCSLAASERSLEVHIYMFMGTTQTAVDANSWLVWRGGSVIFCCRTYQHLLFRKSQ